MRLHTWGCTLLLIGVLVSACSLPIVGTPLPERQIALSDAITNLDSVLGPDLLWTDEQGILLSFLDRDLYHLQNGEWVHRALYHDEECWGIIYYLSGVLSDGRISYLRFCFRNNARDRIEAVTYDWERDQIDFLVSPSMTLPIPGGFTWNPSLTRGVYYTFHGFDVLYWLTPDSLDPIPLTLRDGNREWYIPDSIALEEQYHNDQFDVSRDRYPLGLLGGVSWSPDGTRIAFFATLDSIGEPLGTLNRRPWDLYLMNPETLETEKIVTGVWDAGGPRWSPDGEWIQYSNDGSSYWLVNVLTGRRERIYQGRLGSLSWSPDGKEIALLKCTAGDLCEEYELWVVDVSEIVDAVGE